MKAGEMEEESGADEGLYWYMKGILSWVNGFGKYPECGCDGGFVCEEKGKG